MTDTSQLIMAAYPNGEDAEEDFDNLVDLVGQKQIHTHGVILVERDDQGRVRVHDTGDRLGPQGDGLGRRRRRPGGAGRTAAAGIGGRRRPRPGHWSAISPSTVSMPVSKPASGTSSRPGRP